MFEQALIEQDYVLRRKLLYQTSYGYCQTDVDELCLLCGLCLKFSVVTLG
jgi:hypothetical protein